MVWTPNHWERDCRKKRAGELRKLPAPEANVTSKREKPSPSVLLTLRDESQEGTNISKIHVLTVCLLTQERTPDYWFMDSGAFLHICQDEHLFDTYKSHSSHQHVLLGDNTKLRIKREGEVRIRLTSGDVIKLINVLHVPEITKNLLSVKQLVSDRRHAVNFDNGTCNILRDGRLLAQADLVHNLYALRTRDQCRSEVHNVRTIRINSESLTDLWHKRLGHPSMKKMCNILKSDRYREKLTGLIPSGMTCEPCIMAKHHKIGFPKATTSRATATLQLVDWCAIVVCNSGVQWRRTRQTLLLGKTCRSFYG